jgi:hypothetical protein
MTLKIHLITNCTNGKRSHLKNKTSFGDVLNEHKPNILDWIKATTLNESRDLAINTYMGDHWKVAREASSNNIPLWVLSAGFGFISALDEICSYDATFNFGGENSVSRFTNTTNNTQDNINWWEQLHSNRSSNYQYNLSTMVKNHQNDYFCISASPQYLKVILPELLKLLNLGYITEKNTIIISSKLDIPLKLEPLKLIATEDFCEVLQGSRGSLNIRIARYLIENLIDKDNFRVQVNQKYAQLKKSSKPAKKFDRRKVNDSQVFEYINEKLKSNFLNSSATVLLNAFRSDGFACEQKRFGNIFKQIQESSK